MIITPSKRILRRLAVKVLYIEKTLEYTSRKEAVDYLKKVFEEEIKASANKDDRKKFSEMFSHAIDELDKLIDGKKNNCDNGDPLARSAANDAYILYKNFKNKNSSPTLKIIKKLEEEANFLEKLVIQIFMWWHKFFQEDSIKNLPPNIKKILDKVGSLDLLNDIYKANKSKNFLPYTLLSLEIKKLAKEILESLGENEAVHEGIFSKKSGQFLEEIFFRYIVHSEIFFGAIEERLLFYDLLCELVRHSLSKTFQELGGNIDSLYSTKKICEKKISFFNEILNVATIKEKEIEYSVERVLEKWTLDRVNIIDRIVIQLGAAEMCYIKEYSRAVIIGEYIEISKFYHANQSFKFINGILDKLE